MRASSLPGGVMRVLHSIKPTRCTSFDVRDLIVEHLHMTILNINKTLDKRCLYLFVGVFLASQFICVQSL